VTKEIELPKEDFILSQLIPTRKQYFNYYKGWKVHNKDIDTPIIQWIKRALHAPGYDSNDYLIDFKLNLALVENGWIELLQSGEFENVIIRIYRDAQYMNDIESMIHIDSYLDVINNLSSNVIDWKTLGLIKGGMSRHRYIQSQNLQNDLMERIEFQRKELEETNLKIKNFTFLLIGIILLLVISVVLLINGRKKLKQQEQRISKQLNHIALYKQFWGMI
jgi:hypothetical protein